MKYLFPILGLGLTAYGVFFKPGAAAATPADIGGVTVVALPKGSTPVIGPIKDTTVYKAPDGRYYAMQGAGPLALPLTGSNILNFIQQLKAAG